MMNYDCLWTSIWERWRWKKYGTRCGYGSLTDGPTSRSSCKYVVWNLPGGQCKRKRRSCIFILSFLAYFRLSSPALRSEILSRSRSINPLRPTIVGSMSLYIYQEKCLRLMQGSRASVFVPLSSCTCSPLPRSTQLKFRQAEHAEGPFTAQSSHEIPTPWHRAMPRSRAFFDGSHKLAMLTERP